MTELKTRVNEIPRAGRVILYCDCSESEIAQAHQSLKEKGYKNISVMNDGFKGWLKNKYPVESGSLK
jgi:rhodanese-related sulfurtransferase